MNGGRPAISPPPHLALGANPGELTCRIGSNSPVPLRPTFRDAFSGPSDTFIRFVCDSAKKVVAISASHDRVWDLRFKRVH